MKHLIILFFLFYSFIQAQSSDWFTWTGDEGTIWGDTVGLKMYLPFTEGSGTTVNDRVGLYTGTGTNIIWGNDYLNLSTPGYVTFSPTNYFPLHNWNAVGISPGNVNAHQGVATYGGYIYIIGTNAIKKYNSNYNLISEVTNPLSYTGGNHQGDGDIINDTLYIPVETTSDSVFSNQMISMWKASTLEFIDTVSVSAAGEDVTGLGIDTTNRMLYTASYYNADLIQYNLDGLTYASTITLAGVISEIQGIEIEGGYIYVAAAHGPYTFRYVLSGASRSTMTSGNLGKPYEGLDVDGDYARLLISTGDNDGTVVKFARGFSVSLWVYLTELPSELSTSFSWIFNCSNSNFSIYMDKTLQQLKVKLQTGNRTVIPQANLNKNAWQNLIYVTDEDSSYSYLNGVEIQGLAQNIDISLTQSWQIGDATGASPFKGYIDELKLYLRPLGKTEITDIYNHGRPSKPDF